MLLFCYKKFNARIQSEAVMITILSLIILTKSRQQSACIYGKSHGLMYADCSRKDLENIPINLNSDIQVLDLSINRIFELKNDSFTSYRSLVYLYLQKNFIMDIMPSTFSHLSLTVLDLSNNPPLQALPVLPGTLKRLFLNADKKLVSSNMSSTESFLHIASLNNLEVLHLSSCELIKFPLFGGGYLPNLVELNITNNKFTELTAEDLMPLCNLKYLYTDMLFELNRNSCSCFRLKKWMMDVGLKIDSLACKYTNSIPSGCNMALQNSTTMLTYNSCLNYSTQRLFMKIIFYGGISISVLLTIILAYFICNRRRHRRRRIESPTSNLPQSSRQTKNSLPLQENGQKIGHS